MIAVRDLYKSYGPQEVLRGIDLDVKKGGILVILGESGSGKSVLLRHLVGLERPDRGSIMFGDKDLAQLSEARLLKLRKDIGYLFQEGALYDFLTVAENVGFPLSEHTRMTRAQIKEKVAGLLEMVGLSQAGDKFPSELSGGMNKRAALARSVVLDSQVLLCDEPTSGLDPIKSREISDLIQRISRHIGSATVITSHDMNNALRIADQVVLIKNGEIVCRGTPQDIRDSRNAFVQEFLQGQAV
ncbi:MAG: ABC transporter ATP-binding protein [Candidatus Omnitrophota bacterium]